ncbi:GGDEF domain-containing protein [Acidisoma cellulosilytica]|uniref:diguanylate cyclase n=1 Tax=Acidisoma cellulosilyticum TaxID=2802395 RepID=A0A963YXF1_9PROT|nr:GGDEF domain-containing protein [Acidisoma cellulosilyticum]MCB8878901.1 GGDEF domain-containing protein [Acidisoma cellulosilyticum]
MPEAKLKSDFAAGLVSFRGIAAVIGVAIVVLIAGCILVLLEARADLIYRANLMAENILVLAEQTVEIEISRYDIRLQDIVSTLASPSVQDGVLPDAETLFGGLAERESAGDIIIVNATGQVLISSRPEITSKYVRALPNVLATASFGSNGLGISSVVKARPHEPEVALIRRVRDPRLGQPLNVIAMLPMSWIQGVFSQIKLGDRGIIGLIDANHILLARQPLPPDKLCLPIPVPAALEHQKPGAIFHDERKSAIDGNYRLVTASRVGDLPLFVFVGLSKEDIFQGWNERAIVLLVAVGFLAVVVVALTVAVIQQLRSKLLQDRQLHELNHQLEELARTDQLTALLNRRGFDENIAREWRRCRRSLKPISLLMIDADYFKQYNDHYGHQSGDNVLRMLARCIEETIRRPGDIAARYGGEEFAVVLPDTHRDGAMLIAEKIQAQLASLAIEHAPIHGVVTISVGVANAVPGGAATVEQLVALADAALYQSKTDGRNRITLAGSQPAA